MNTPVDRWKGITKREGNYNGGSRKGSVLIPYGGEMSLHIDKLTAIVLALFECLSVYMIVGIWRKRGKRRTPVWSRCLWTTVLLVPLFGPLLYGFIKVDPDEHPYESIDYSRELVRSEENSQNDPGLHH